MTTEALVEVAGWLADGRPATVGRVVAIAGFSTWPGEELVAVDRAGGWRGGILGRVGTDAVVRRVAHLRGQVDALETVIVEVHGEAVAEAGLSCGGRADVLLQPSSSIPAGLWDALAARRPVALVTRIEGASAGPSSMVVEAGGSWTGALAEGDPDHLAGDAAALLTAGHGATRRVEDGAGTVLIECWVPEPRVVVAGAGELAGAVTAQAALLGWETRTIDTAEEVEAALEWGGPATAAVVVSHDGTLDVVTLAGALEARAAYVGALGSRRTQSRRLEALAALGLPEADLDRIHRPIGLDLGGRSAPEIALAVVAEILATRCGRTGGSLSGRDGPIHDRP